MGLVRIATDTSLGRQVAVKVLRPELLNQAEVVDRFLTEARLAATLEHPHIMPVHAVGWRDGLGPMFTMKLVTGHTLFDHLRGNRGAPKGDALEHVVKVLIRVCEALAYAHSRGVVHGDIKSRNIMLGEHDVVYLMDWGNARAVGKSAPVGPNGKPLVLGTLAMISPEQACGDAVDARTDVFGMGALLYTLLARRVPYGRGGPEGRIDAAKIGRFDSLDKIAPRVPPALRDIAQRAMAVDPDDRYATITQMHHALQAFQRGRVPAPEVAVRKGQVLIREGDTSDVTYIVVSGSFAVTKGRGASAQRLSQVGPGEVLGEIGLLAKSVRTATVIALEDGVVRRLEQQRIRDQLSRTAPWMRTVIQSLAKRLHKIS